MYKIVSTFIPLFGFFSENKCWTNWINNDSPSTGDGDTETSSSACASPTSFACQTVDGLSMPDVELNETTCLSSGITCLNSDQRADRSCPDFKVRYVCTCPCKHKIPLLVLFIRASMVCITTTTTTTTTTLYFTP